jgi:hypothetical protein
MNINRHLRFCGLFALALLAISTVPTAASAQVFRGKFTLPFAAHWGGLALPAGEYSFTADSLTASSFRYHVFPGIASCNEPVRHN